MFAKTIAALVCSGLMAAPLVAQPLIRIDDAYARAMPGAPTGAAFFVIVNDGDTDDRLIDATGDIAARIELHTHVQEDGVMRMVHVPDGFAIPANGSHTLARGGDHVMLMGLTSNLADGDIVTLTLVFEMSGEMMVNIPVDLTRQPDSHGMGHDHDHGHGQGHNHGT